VVPGWFPGMKGSTDMGDNGRPFGPSALRPFGPSALRPERPGYARHASTAAAAAEARPAALTRSGSALYVCPARDVGRGRRAGGPPG
jgi:hypothetical protein